MLLIDEPRTSPGDADALIEEARKRTRRRRRRVAVVLTVTAAGIAYLLGGGGGGSGRTGTGAHGAPLPGGAVRGTAQSVSAAGRLAVLPNISEFGLLAPGEGWAANGLSFYFTDDGAHWKTLTVPKLTGGDITAKLFAATSVGRNDIFLSYTTGRAYGSCTHPTGPALSGGIFYTIGSVARSTDRGRTWQLSTLPGCVIATALSFVNTQTGYALAETTFPPRRSWLLATRDGGRTWRRVTATPFTGQIDFTSAVDGWAAAGTVSPSSQVFLSPTHGGALYHTTNAGHTWERLALCSTASAIGTFTVCGTPRFFGPTDGVVPVTAVDRRTNRAWLIVDRTTNGGRTWSGTRLPSVSATPSMRYGTGQAGKLVAVSATNWIALVGPRLYETTNAGSHRTTLVPNPDLSASRVFEIDFASARDGWLVEDPFSSKVDAQPIFDYTTDSGRTWHPRGRY
jgi:photosystem II stability/assembly factor-like uncharacterized protein